MNEGQRGSDSESGGTPPKRFAFYVDGFNAYHSLVELGKPHLKWLSWMKLSRLIVANLRETGIVTRIVFCAAPPDHMGQSRYRHQTYVGALEAEGVVVRQGYFLREAVECRSCGADWKKYHEKEGDVSLALSLIDDAYQDVFDVACLVTNDGDQVPTVRLFKERFGPRGKRLISVAPDWMTRGISRVLAGTADQSARISEQMVARSLLGKTVYRLADGKVAQAIARPAEYDPPR